MCTDKEGNVARGGVGVGNNRRIDSWVIIGVLMYPPSGVTRQKLIQLRRNCNLKI